MFEPIVNVPSSVSPVVIPFSVPVSFLVNLFRFVLEKIVAASAFAVAIFVAAVRPESKPNIFFAFGLLFVGVEDSLK